MPKKVKYVVPEFLPLRGLCEDVNHFLMAAHGGPPDIRIKISSAPELLGSATPGPPKEETIDVTKLIVRMSNYIAMLEVASRELLDTGSPERLLAVRSAREKEVPKTSLILQHKPNFIH